MRIDRQAVFEKHNGHCGYCGESITVKSMQIDHIKPKEYYPALSHDFDNLMPACRQCNNFKNVYDLEEFRNQLSQQLERSRKYSVNYRMAFKFKQVVESPGPIIFYFERKLTLAS